MIFIGLCLLGFGAALLGAAFGTPDSPWWASGIGAGVGSVGATVVVEAVKKAITEASVKTAIAIAAAINEEAK